MYLLLQGGKEIQSEKPGLYAGHSGYRIFGTLDCASGRRMKCENRVFFKTLEDAVNEGYRPCKLCKPLDEEAFEQIKPLVPHLTLSDFYNSGKKFKK